MGRYGKEIVLGTIPALLLFLPFAGVNAAPVFVAAAIAFVAFAVVRSRGGGAFVRRRQPAAAGDGEPGFDDVGGQERAKQELAEALDFLIRRDEIRRLGIRPLKGILLTGPPGTGKTLLARAAARHTDSVFVAASGSEFVEMYVGVGASRVRDLFREARRQAEKRDKKSAIIFIDEIDAIGGKRDGGQQREYDQTLNQLLTEMDGIDAAREPRILLIAATNRPEMLDPALLRPGRFDRLIEVGLPDKAGRLHILRLHARNKPLDPSVSLEQLAGETYGFSGAQLESVMNEAAIYAMREGSPAVMPRHLSMAVDKVMMGERTDRETTREERRRVAIHELGHAVVAETVRPGSVSQISLSPRGRALGYVRHNPGQDRYLHTKTHLEQQIMIALGGAAAEELFYGERSTGSRGDFDQALGIVSLMMESGLTRLGIIDRSMVTKEQLMNENAAILGELTERTRRLLKERRAVFDRCLDVLLREERLDGDAFRAFLAEVARVSA